MDVAVIVATFGEQKWVDLAHERAIPSVARQTMAPAACIYAHGKTLAEARNDAAESCDAKWLIFLDADDELAPDYVEQMHRKTIMSPDASIFVPMVQYVHPDREEAPRQLGPYVLRDQNYIVIGAPVKRVLFDAAGGFWGERAWEDWSLWLRCERLGAESAFAPRAVYRAYVNPSSRNRVERPQQLRKDILTAFDDWAATK